MGTWSSGITNDPEGWGELSMRVCTGDQDEQSGPKISQKQSNMFVSEMYIQQNPVKSSGGPKMHDGKTFQAGGKISGHKSKSRGLQPNFRSSLWPMHANGIESQ